MHTSSGRLIGVGLGPGDPELITLKGLRAIESADIIVYHAKPGGKSAARTLAGEYIRADQEELLLEYPVTTGSTDHPHGYAGAMAEFYADAYQKIATHLNAGKKVCVISIGDPMLYSSYQHLYELFKDEYPTDIIPGVNSFSAGASASHWPIAIDQEHVAIIPGTSSIEKIRRHLHSADRAIIMKLGKKFSDIYELLKEENRLEGSFLISHASTEKEKITPLDAHIPDKVPYFSILLVGPVGAPARTAGSISVVGLGPGPMKWQSPEVTEEISKATDIIGYSTYIRRLEVQPWQKVHASDNRVEKERAYLACKLAAQGKKVLVVSSGDPGIFAMATPVIEEAKNWEVSVQVLPGISAAHAAASRVGAPLGHDCAFISLSDNLKPWSIIEKRVRALIDTDMSFAVYNPASKSRTEQLKQFFNLIPEDRIVIQARAVGSTEEKIIIARACDIILESIDMKTILIIGASNTHIYEHKGVKRVYTTRYYRHYYS